MASAARVDLDGNPIKPITICMIGAGGFIGSHLCEKLMAETPHKVLAVDVYNDKIKHLLEPASLPWSDRIQFHRINIKNDSRLESLIKMADLTINLAAICTPADYNTRPLDTIYSNFIDALPVVKYCSENNKRIIHFSTCEVYGKTIGCFLPKDHPLRLDPAYFVLKEDDSPCIFGPIEKQRWSYACAKQLIERLIYAEGAENGLEFTIVRPFNWIGPRMDFIPGIDGPSEGVPRVLACFSNNLLRREPLKLVDGGQSQRTFVYIKDAIEAVLLMIENPARANGHIFNVGNPNNEVTVRQLAEMMTQVYSKVSLILRGANDYMLDEMERALHDSLCIIKRTLESNTVVAGGGAVEAALSVYLEYLATTLGSREQLAIAEFAESLLIIPKILAVNAAKDATELVAKLRAYHHIAQTKPDKKHLSSMGLDLLKGTVRNNLEAGVIEPAMSKVKIIQFATEAAITILRIDDVGDIIFE